MAVGSTPTSAAIRVKKVQAQRAAAACLAYVSPSNILGATVANEACKAQTACLECASIGKAPAGLHTRARSKGRTDLKTEVRQKRESDTDKKATKSARKERRNAPAREGTKKLDEGGAVQRHNKACRGL